MRQANKWRWLVGATGTALAAVLVAGFFVRRWTKVTSISVSLGVPTPLMGIYAFALLTYIAASLAGCKNKAGKAKGGKTL
jgi:hypothetical protein